MKLIPAYLPITKLKIYSIDKKGKAVLGIKILCLFHSEFGTHGKIENKSFTKYSEDQLIFVKHIPDSDKIFVLDRVIGSASKIENWNYILTYRLGLDDCKQIVPYVPRILKNISIKESTEYRKMDEYKYEYLLIDNAGTIDREDGIWWKSDKSFGTFVIDIPTQFGWTHNSQSAVSQLLNMLEQDNKTNKHIHMNLYFEGFRIPTMNSYYCISEDTLREHKRIPILCWDYQKKLMFSSEITCKNKVWFETYDNQSPNVPKWFDYLIKTYGYDVAKSNTLMNSNWFRSLKYRSEDYVLMDKIHYKYDSYYPISSPVRSIIDIWNQCAYWDIIQKHKHNNLIELQAKLLKPVICKSIMYNKFIRHYNSSKSLVEYMFKKYKNKNASVVMRVRIVHTLYDKKGAFIEIIESTSDGLDMNNIQFWVPDIVSIDKKIGDIFLCSFILTRHKDPFRIIKIRTYHPPSPQTPHPIPPSPPLTPVPVSIEDTKMES